MCRSPSIFQGQWNTSILQAISRTNIPQSLFIVKRLTSTILLNLSSTVYRKRKLVLYAMITPSAESLQISGGPIALSALSTTKRSVLELYVCPLMTNWSRHRRARTLRVRFFNETLTVQLFARKIMNECIAFNKPVLDIFNQIIEYAHSSMTVYPSWYLDN